VCWCYPLSYFTEMLTAGSLCADGLVSKCQYAV
jgi:hypothetical protein